MAGSGLMFMAIVITNTFWTTMEQQEVPPEVLSRVDSISWLTSLVGMPLAMAGIGPLSAWIGVKTTLLASAALAAVALLGALSVRDLRDLRSLDGGEVSDAASSATDVVDPA